MPRRAAWSWGNLPARSEDVVVYLNQRLSDLEEYLAAIHRDLSFGPIDGVYLGVYLGADDAGALPDGTLDRFTFPFEADVALLQLYCLGGNATVDVESGGSSILAAGSQALIGGTSVFLNLATDFAATPMHVTSDLTLVKDSTDLSNPNRIHCRIILKNVSKVETV